MSEAPSRAAQRAATQRRNRLFLVGGGILAVVAIVVVVLVVSGGGDSGGGNQSSSTTSGPKTTVALQAGDISTESAGPATSLSADQAQQVLTSIRAYLDDAAIEPLRSGKPAGDLSAVFDAGTLAKVTGADRPIMVQEGLPKVTGDLSLDAAPVTFVGLGDQDGKLVLVTAALKLTIEGEIAESKTPLHIEQQGDLVFAPDATGAWKVTAYKMSVTRSGGGVDVTTTLPAPKTTKAGK